MLNVTKAEIQETPNWNLNVYQRHEAQLQQIVIEIQLIAFLILAAENMSTLIFVLPFSMTSHFTFFS